MRYKFLIFSVLLLCATMLLLVASEQITLYIHPRYVGFSIVMTVATMLVLLASWRSDHPPVSGKYVQAGVVCVALLAGLLPARSLSARIAGDRSTTSPALQQGVAISSFDAFSKDFSRFSLQDWASLLADPSNQNIVADKEASVSGFLFRDEQNRPFIARFKMSCCAVDATPVKLPLSGPLADNMTTNQWYAVRGKFIPTGDQQQMFILQITDVQPIDEPEDPYVY